jgi:hypothetical protein
MLLVYFVVTLDLSLRSSIFGDPGEGGGGEENIWFCRFLVVSVLVASPGPDYQTIFISKFPINS